MSKYRVVAVSGNISVTCDGERITLKPLLSLTSPPFAINERSDASMNLGHAILHHCCGEGEAKLLYRDFAAEFLVGKGDQPIEITSDAIRAFVARTASAQCEAQTAVWKLKKI